MCSCTSSPTITWAELSKLRPLAPGTRFGAPAIFGDGTGVATRMTMGNRPVRGSAVDNMMQPGTAVLTQVATTRRRFGGQGFGTSAAMQTTMDLLELTEPWANRGTVPVSSPQSSRLEALGLVAS
jgi:hypothetical protein